jgi:hypothetical protein
MRTLFGTGIKSKRPHRRACRVLSSWGRISSRLAATTKVIRSNISPAESQPSRHTVGARWIVIAVFMNFVAFPLSHGSSNYSISDSQYGARASGARQDVYWLDNDRLVFIGVRPSERRNLKGAPYGLFLWDLKTGRITQQDDVRIENADLCVYRGYIRLDYTSDYGVPPVSRAWFVLEGTWGKLTKALINEQAREESRRNERFLNYHTCREYKPAELPPKGLRVYPLLPGEFISRDRDAQPGEVVHPKYWPRHGSPVTLSLTAHDVGVARYSEYLNTYVLDEAPFHFLFGETVVRRSWLLDRDGRTRDFTPPTGPWMRGSTSVAPTRRGLFLVSHAVSGAGNGAAGGYLLDGAALKRVVSGLPTSFDVSPNGCRVALPIIQIRPDEPNSPSVTVVDLCSRER